MLTLGELYQRLSYGELSNLAMSGEGSGEILPAHERRVLNYTNDALLKIYSRFCLKQADVLLQLRSWITTYHFEPKYAQSYIPTGSADTVQFPYILDSKRRPFLNDVIKIITVFDDNGNQLPLNDDNRVSSLFTPQPNVLQAPQPIEGEILSVLYQARHPKLNNDPESKIEVPDILVEALTGYIAYKVFSHMNSQDSTARAQEHLAVFNGICADVVDQDLVNSSIAPTNSRFSARGWT